MTFSTALTFVRRPDIEGGYVDNPADPGGATNHGITQTTYDEWRTAHEDPLQDVRLILDDEVAAIYCGRYWGPAHCAELPDRLATLQFDTAVQRGVQHAVEMLQGALGLTVDGRFGMITLRAAQQCDETTTLLKYLDARAAHIAAEEAKDPATQVFDHGWRNRLTALRQYLNLPSGA